MTSRSGQSGSTQHAENYKDDFELLPSRSSNENIDSIQGDIDTGFDASILPRQSQTWVYRSSSVSFAWAWPMWLREVMSRSPLLRSSGTRSVSSYASVPGHDDRSRSNHERAGKNISGESMSSRQSSLASGVGVPAREGGSLFDDIEPLLEHGDDEDQGVQDDGKARHSTPGNTEPLENSPFAQVRASVSAVDNITLSISTPRMWILSLVFALLGSATNLFFSLRYPSVAITPVIALVLVHPLGRAWDSILKRDDDPRETFENGVLSQRSESEAVLASNSSLRHRLRLWLAQGHWNEKEHACVYISSNVSFGFAFATDVIVEQTQFYHQDVGIMYQVLLTISTQILGYAFAGLTRRYLVRPASMIWPGTLMSTAMFTTMHKSENKIANGWRITRWKFFVLVWSGAFLWYFLPGLLMPALSYFSVVTWFAPKSVVVANLFGVSSGLGLFPMTFDWAQIAYIGSPLLTPWWAAANVVGGLAFVMWIIAPILYYGNTFYSSFMPILSSVVFDNTGNPYDVTKVLTPDFLFDREAYEQYSPVYLPITYVLSYAVQFASLSALVTHTICWHGRDIWAQTKQIVIPTDEFKVDYREVHQSDAGSGKSKKGDATTSLGVQAEPSYSSPQHREDVHHRLMQRYEDAPASWYLFTFIAMLMIGVFLVEYYPVHLPWYGLLLALAITTVMFLPVAIIMAITNQHSSLYLICQLICGYVFPGRPVANMVFVTYCYISSAQGIKFSSDLKLGHYMKIPPKILFTVQMVATLVSSLTQVGVLNWMFVNIRGICTPEAVNGFICPIARVHFNGSILWGLIGPQRFFGQDALYRNLIWAFLVGAIAPPVVWLIGRRSERNLWRKISFPVLFGSLSWIPPATGLNFSVWALVCFTFNYVIRRRAFAWWGKYTMTMSAALDSGLAFSLLVVFFGFIYPGWMDGFKWWGTEVYKQGCDWQACSYKSVAPGEHFGPG
ncbi:hypothetical protein MMC15_007018 [Xylographa vitiligo]|nr:hypothetical protein [Xylographa vitiligo]